MSYILRSSAAAVRHVRPSAPVRSFHSPFIVLGQTPRKVQSQPSASVDVNPFAVYEKEYDFTHEPSTLTSGNRTYVVSQPDASASYYRVPSGAYPTSSPYVNFVPGEAPNPQDAQVSSTPSSPVHVFTTRAAPQKIHGVGESSAVRYATAPGKIGGKGVDGGLGRNEGRAGSVW